MEDGRGELNGRRHMVYLSPPLADQMQLSLEEIPVRLVRGREEPVRINDWVPRHW